MIKYEIRQEIIAQALEEISFARNYKQGKVKNWKLNEDLYYGRKPATDDSRSNVDLGQMASHVHTILSKIDNPLTFKYVKRKNSQLQRINYLNSLKRQDQDTGNWDIKDIAGKKQASIYGRAIYSFYADSYEGYCAHLDNVDVYDFLIDPSAGGIDIERGMYMGDFGVVLTRQQIKDGVKDKIYLKTEVETLLEGDGNSLDSSQEQTNKINRTQAQNVWKTQKEIGNKDKFKFWRWCTTYEGKRYYLLLSEKGGTAIRVSLLKDIFSSNLWPYWTWAAFPDLTEFWTPSFCDYVRDIFMAQAVSINQMLDNAEQINKPQKVVQVGAIENLAELRYRKNGLIKVKKDIDIAKAFQEIRPPSINTPIQVFNLLDAIQEKASGVTAAAQGAAENDSGSKVAIYEGNQENSADRFGFLNRSYSFGYKRFATLYEWGVRDNLVKKTAVEMLGPDGIDIIMVSRRDIFRSGEKFGVMVEASNAELALSASEKKAKLEFLAAMNGVQDNSGKPVQNQKKAYEIQAEIAGFDEETIRQLMDVSDFGTADLMAEADRDIERILDGEKVEPNEAADTAYKQRFVTYMLEHKEDIDEEQFQALADYVMALDPIIMRNMTARANAMIFKMQMDSLLDPKAQVPGAPGAGGTGQPGEEIPQEGAIPAETDPANQNQPLQ